MKEKIEVETTEVGCGKSFEIYEIEFIEENYLSKMLFLDENKMERFVKNMDVPREFVKINKRTVWID